MLSKRGYWSVTCCRCMLRFFTLSKLHGWEVTVETKKILLWRQLCSVPCLQRIYETFIYHQLKFRNSCKKKVAQMVPRHYCYEQNETTQLRLQMTKRRAWQNAISGLKLMSKYTQKKVLRQNLFLLHQLVIQTYLWIIFLNHQNRCRNVSYVVLSTPKLLFQQSIQGLDYYSQFNKNIFYINTR